MSAAVLDAKTLPDIFSGKRGPEKKEGELSGVAVLAHSANVF
jgi:hypothetical protein